MKTNQPCAMVAETHEGGRADAHQTPLVELTRAVSTCLLFENTFYEKGSDMAGRIEALCAKVKPEELAALAVKARTDLKLRHVPLFLARQMARLHKGKLVGDVLASVIQRPDEMSEFLSLYWKDKKQPLSAQVKRGLAGAFTKFNEYSLAKWNRDGAVKLRDVLFLCHAKPKDAEQDDLWKRLVKGELAVPDTWEVALSTGQDKRATWERLLREKRLGYIALLMNLRNMTEAGVDRELVESAIRVGAPKSRALPFRFLSAAKHAPQYAAALSDALLSVPLGTLPGATDLVIDVSGSMDYAISGKSQLTRLEAASALAVLFRQVSRTCRVWTFSTALVEVPNYRGLPLVEAIARSQSHQGTYLAGALMELSKKTRAENRLVVITDEQTHDGIVPILAGRAYLVNVAGYKPGLDVSHGWHRVSGWSERVCDWICLEETGKTLNAGDDED